MKNKSKKKIIFLFLYIFFIIVILVSGIYIIKFFLLRQEAIEESRLLNSIILENTDTNNNNSSQKESINKEAEIESDEKNDEKETERMLKVDKLQEQNEDIVGWIEIENTNINYPVLQGDDNEYYLTHNYQKEKTEKGSIFLDADYDWSVPSNNLLVYGHNLVNGQMFKDLLKYSEEEFYKEHPIIRFTTEKEDKEYEIISAFKARVYYQSEENVFRYYNFINSTDEEEYSKFIKNAKKVALYDTGKTAEFGDELITLITCSYHTDDGRFVVIGRKNEK